MIDYKYPYTDFNEYNLDWVIVRIKELTEQWVAYKTKMDADWANMQSDWTAMKADLEELKAYITNYFDNLDVQQEINHKIDQMAADGSLLALIQSTVISQTTSATEAWLAAHVNPQTGYVVDNTLSIAGAAADSKTTGDAINSIKDILDVETYHTVTETTFDPIIGFVTKTGSTGSSSDYCHTSKISVSEGDVIRAIVDGMAKNFRFVCAYNGDTAIEAKGRENVSSYTVPSGVTDVVLTVGYSPAYQIYNYKITSPYEESARLVDLENTILPELEVLSVLDVETFYNHDDIEFQPTTGYVTKTGQIYSSPDYCYSSEIEVSEGDVITAKVNGLNKNMRFICAFDENNQAVEDAGAENLASYTVPAGIVSIIITVGYSESYTNYICRIASPYKDSARFLKLENLIDPKLNFIETSENYPIETRNAIRKNLAFNFFAAFGTFTSLLIGKAMSDTYVDNYDWYFEIDNTTVKLHRRNDTTITWNHGLTISDYISVSINYDFNLHCYLTIATNNATANNDFYIPINGHNRAFYVLNATDPVAPSLSLTCKDFDKNVAVLGDSYITNGSSRWPYYLPEALLNNILLCGYAGESSNGGLVELDYVMKYGNNKFILWAYGMNDGPDSNDTTPRSEWLENIQTFIDTVSTRGIIPILATIPTVPEINHNGKNKWVRESGYHYVDFAAAVNDGTDGTWYDGMLSSDDVHPTTAGARALCNRLMTDLQEINVI